MKLLGEVKVLGEKWAIYNQVKLGEHPELDSYEGITESTTRCIYIADFDELIEKDMMRNVADKNNELRSCIRHELIHAFLLETGLNENSHKRWAINEEMVEYFATNIPKMNKVFKALNVQN